MSDLTRPVATPAINLSKRGPLEGWANTWAFMSPALRLRFTLATMRILDDWKAAADLIIDEPVAP